MVIDETACRRAVQSRDERFDGWFYLAVTSTRIYCRPSCPAMTPKAENMRFFPSSAAAQQAGFRACKRCRPDASPGSPEWHQRADVTARAMRLIGEGVVDREGVPGLAARLGYSTRQVERQLTAELGAGPLALARAQRAQTARLLIETSSLTMTDIAFAAGFASIRAFNDTIGEVFASAPTELRRRAQVSTISADGTPKAAASSGAILRVRMPFRRPLCPDNLFGHLATTAVPGVEEWRDGAYRTTMRLPRGAGIAALRPTANHIECILRLADVRDLPAAIARCRRLLDLDADPAAVDAALRVDPALAPLVDAHPGRRVPHTVDPGEFAVRAVLGQQVSTLAARTLAGRLTAALGDRIEDPDGELTHLFPSPAALAGLDPDAYQPEVLRVPRARRRALIHLATALATGEVDLSPGCDWQEARARLAQLPGMGPWTIETIAMRALGDPNAFTPGDLGVRNAAKALGLPSTPAALTRHAAGWRPWRAYAVQYLWATGDHPINNFPHLP
jgi:AraC family transcriptional regulator of adaptative response / DNA-3-methyladenine glycosylase II